MSEWQPYLIAIVIGLLVGIERERAHPTPKAMGVRTFLLIGLLGAIAGGLANSWIAALLSAFTLGLILISYFHQSVRTDRGLTTEFAAGIIFCLGYVSHESPALAALVGPIVALILFSKASLHRFTHLIKASELEAALLLLLGGVVVLNFVPDAVIDRWGIFNPKKFGYLILTLATLEFSSYVLAKTIGQTRGALAVGFFGGLVSSTAVLLSSARQSQKSPEAWLTLLASTLAAKAAAIMELLLIVGVVSSDLLLFVAPPSLASLAVCGIALVFCVRRRNHHTTDLTLKSPLDWRGVLRLSLMLGAILAAISMTRIWLGENATFAISFLTGLFELHGVSLATATMHKQGHLTAATAGFSILLALAASLLAKVVIAWILSRGRFARALTAVFVAMIAVVAVTSWLFSSLPGK